MRQFFIVVTMLFCIEISAQIQIDYTENQTITLVGKQIPTDGGYITLRNVPDGNYKVKVWVGGDVESTTVIKAESRRLMRTICTKAGETTTATFLVNKRDTMISADRQVKIKPRERSKLNWDSHLTIEIGGQSPRVQRIDVEPITNAITVFLCGNSTVVDQDFEPWASWGQMITQWFDSCVCVANYGESGESSNTFIAARRLEKIASIIKPGDYLMVEFGHNDEKQKGDDKGAYKHFTAALRQYIAVAREHDATVVLLTPTQRRWFDENNRLVDTHGDFPQAVRDLAAAENVALIDLHAMTTKLYEALGNEKSKCAFVHYPANTYPNQTQALADNTHFNPFGAYEIARCVVEGMKECDLPIIKHLCEIETFDPSQPDDVSSFVWYDSPNFEAAKPDGN